MVTTEFQKIIKQRGRQLYRPMPWREDTRPYYVLVSEIMLQQTQVGRVLPKFNEFVATFPSEAALARSDLAAVLRAWQGLGYNRRAKYLHEAAKKIIELGHFPDSEEELLSLPGIGKNTAGAILAYGFNQPVLFLETNIRTVYTHHFFHDQTNIDDKQILEKLAETVPWAEEKEQPEQRIYSVQPALVRKTVGLSYGPKAFYWALMDYGSWLKANGVRNNAHSKHYTKQSPLKGSVREVRGKILALLSLQGRTPQYLKREFPDNDLYQKALAGLKADGLVEQTGQTIHLTK